MINELPKDILILLIKEIRKETEKEIKTAAEKILLENEYCLNVIPIPGKNRHEYIEINHKFVLKQLSDMSIELIGVEENKIRRNLTFKEKIIASNMRLKVNFKEIDYYKFTKRELLYIIVNSDNF